jgi:hypothetical protein
VIWDPVIHQEYGLLHVRLVSVDARPLENLGAGDDLSKGHSQCSYTLKTT